MPPQWWGDLRGEMGDGRRWGQTGSSPFSRTTNQYLPNEIVQINIGKRPVCPPTSPTSSPDFRLPIAGLVHSSSDYLSSHGDNSFKVKRQRSSLGVAAVPSDQWPTGIMNSVIGSGAP
jgi:hypothetical protein